MSKGRKTGGRDFKIGHDQPGPGRPPRSESEKFFSKLTRTTLEALLSRYLSMTMEELERVTNNPQTPVLELLIGSVLQKGLIEGDHRRLNFLFDRMVGKCVEKVELKTHKPFIIEGTAGQRVILGVSEVDDETGS